MVALSVQQPWAHLIVSGLKPVENRSWATKYRGPLFIHAATSRVWLEKITTPDMRHVADALCGLGITDPIRELRYGAIVGMVDVVDCLPIDDARLRGIRFHQWATGPFCWVVENAKAITPIPMKGRLGLFKVDIATAA